MGTQTHTDRIAALAEGQHGVVARRQLREAGVPHRAIQSRLSRGILVPLHRGVYAFGHRHLTLEGRWLAAVLAAGPGAALSHRDAAALHGMRKPPESAKVSVSTPAHPRGIPGVWLYARCRLHEQDVTVVRGIRTTSPARTLVDLAALLTAAQLQATIGETDRRGLLDVEAVERALRRTRGRHGQGHRRLTAALDTHMQRGTTLLRSELEERFLDLIVNAGIPQPLLNAPAAGYEVDALWPGARLVVELDGWAHHKGRRAAAADRDKTNDLQLAGYTVLRFLHGDLVHRRHDVADAITGALTG